MLQNAQMALDFLRYKKIKLVNIRAEDIVDGNPKLTLGLIWTIILHFQVSKFYLFTMSKIMSHGIRNQRPEPVDMGIDNNKITKIGKYSI